jgi:hypothetical protein
MAQPKKRSGHSSKLSVATLDLMKKSIKKNPTLTASKMKTRMRIEKATTSLYTDMINKLLFIVKKILFFNFFVLRSQFLNH